jgi:hypothetical protein
MLLVPFGGWVVRPAHCPYITRPRPYWYQLQQLIRSA